jgi:hypothetical protein
MKLNLLSVAKRLRRYGVIFSLAVFSMLFLTQCFVKRPSMTTGVVDRVALMGTLVSFQEQGGIGAAEAICRTQLRNVSTELNELMASYPDTLNHAAAANLRTQLGCEVIYGKELQSLPQYEKIMETYGRPDALTSADEHFPNVYISSGDFNFLVTGSDVNYITIFNGLPMLKGDEARQTISNICSELDVKYLAYAHFVLTGYKMYLITPINAMIYCRVNLYNQDGDLIGIAYKPYESPFSEGQAELFQFMLDQYIDNAESIEFRAQKPKKD